MAQAMVEIMADRVLVRTGKVELGQGLHTALAQIVADELGVPVGQIQMLPVDTDSSPDQGVTSGSQSVQEAGRALREACAALRQFHLPDGTLYSSCEPCPMCLSAIYWARIPTVFYGNTRTDAAAIGFDDDFIYRQVPLPPEKRAIKMSPLLREAALATFQSWAAKTDKVRY